MDVVDKILGNTNLKVYKCSVCKSSYTNRDITMDKANVFPAGAKFGRGYANVAYQLPCGHYMLDDRSSGCPAYVREV